MRDGNDKSCALEVPLFYVKEVLSDLTAINQTWTSLSNSLQWQAEKCTNHTRFCSLSMWVKLSGGLCFGHRGFGNIHLMGLFISFIFL